MSTLPEIDQTEVFKRAINKTNDLLTSKLLEALIQISQMEVLAESLRDERDQYKDMLDNTVVERDRLRDSLAELPSNGSEQPANP